MNRSLLENTLDACLPALDLTAPFFADKQPESAVGEKYIAFLLGEEFYAVSTKKVIEVTSSLAVALLPNAPAWLLGIANLRGEIVSVLNLPAIFGRTNSTLHPKSKFIVLRSPAFEFGAAFAADRLNEIVTVPDEKIQSVKDKNIPFVFGKASHQSHTLNLIDTEKLLASLIVG